MRKRWTFSPGPFIALWGVGGLIGLFLVAGLTDGCQKHYVNECGLNGPMSKWTYIEGSIWLGPFVLAVLGAILFIAVPDMAKALWKARPRRISEPVSDDLREIHPPH